MNKLILILILLSACSGGSGSSDGPAPVENEKVLQAYGNTCETAVNVTDQVISATTSGDLWLSYTVKSDTLQIDTCDSGQNGTFEVYFNCEWYNSERGTINGRNDQKVNDCFPGFYGDVKGVRDIEIKIRILPDAEDLVLPYHVNFNEIGF